MLSYKLERQGKKLIKTLENQNINMHFQCVGVGTAPTEMMDIFGLGSNDKDIIISFAADGKVTASSAKIRKEASTTSDVVGSAKQNDTFTITAETTGADGRIWYEISFDGNKKGYIRSDLMQKTGDVFDGKKILIDEGFEVRKIQGRVYNIVFTKIGTITNRFII